MLIIFCKVVSHSGNRGVDLGSTEFFGGNLFAGCGFDERRSSQKNGACAANDHALIGHGWNIGASRSTKPMHAGYLLNAFGTHAGLIKKNAAKVIFIREDLILHGQERAA